MVVLCSGYLVANLPSCFVRRSCIVQSMVIPAHPVFKLAIEMSFRVFVARERRVLRHSLRHKLAVLEHLHDLLADPIDQPSGHCCMCGSDMRQLLSGLNLANPMLGVLIFEACVFPSLLSDWIVLCLCEILVRFFFAARGFFFSGHGPKRGIAWLGNVAFRYSFFKAEEVPYEHSAHSNPPRAVSLVPSDTALLCVGHTIDNCKPFASRAQR